MKFTEDIAPYVNPEYFFWNLVPAMDHYVAVKKS